MATLPKMLVSRPQQLASKWIILLSYDDNNTVRYQPLLLITVQCVLDCGRHSSLVVHAFDSKSSRPSSNLPRCINEYWRI